MKKNLLLVILCLILLPVFSAMAFVFSRTSPPPSGGGWNSGLATDSNVIAVWNFESSLASSKPSGGSAVSWTDNSDTDEISYVANDVNEGLGYAAYCDTDDWASITDSLLPSGFPAKNGGSVATWSATFWYKAVANIGSAAIIEKGTVYATDNASFRIQSTYRNAKFSVGITNGEQWSNSEDSGNALTLSTWYFVAITWTDSTKTVQYYVYNSNGTLFRLWEHTYGAAMNVEDGILYLNADVTNDDPMTYTHNNMYIDELVFWNKVIDTDDIAALIAGTY